MEEIIRGEDEFYILATTSIAEKNRRVLKHGETFAVFDHYGDILCLGSCEQGIFHEGTRFLSRLELRLGNNRPLLLSSTIRESNDVLAVDLTNPDILVNVGAPPCVEAGAPPPNVGAPPCVEAGAPNVEAPPRVGAPPCVEAGAPPPNVGAPPRVGAPPPNVEAPPRVGAPPCKDVGAGPCACPPCFKRQDAASTFKDEQIMIPRGTLHIFRSKFLWQGSSFERLRVSNYGLTEIKTSFSLRYDADFVDIFEVRGMVREQRGKRLDDIVEESRVILSYEGLDRKIRQTHLEFSPRPAWISSSEARFEVDLQPKQSAVFFMTVCCTCELSNRHSRENNGSGFPRAFPKPLALNSHSHETGGLCGDGNPEPGKFLPHSYQSAWTEAAESLKNIRGKICKVSTSNEQFNEWLDRSQADLYMMLTNTPQGLYPYAGVPWFSTAFGRDGIITALQMLWVDPDIARGVLSYLAFTQARSANPRQDAEPGKILHETRKGEMAELGEIPFGRYYGSVDATPLFIILAGAYYERTKDLELIESIWPNIMLALEWIDTRGDVDGDGFVEYQRHRPEGLINQGWKDSHDAVWHADGTLAQGPIALCEVQGYVYDARQKAAYLACALGHTGLAERLLDQAQTLKERFEKGFWCEELSLYALALDGNKIPCRVRTSNAGHCLFSGIATEEHALRTAETLLGNGFFSGWGIRTVADSEERYNPMSYHNGSIWPHDNSLIAYGLARYRLNRLIPKIMAGLLDATISMDLHRMPELFCGFVRRPGEAPTLYPVACAPQAWAIGSVFLLLQSCLGLSINATKKRNGISQNQISFCYPFLPDFLKEVEIKNLKVGGASIDLSLRRHVQDVGITVLRREGDVKIVTVK